MSTEMETHTTGVPSTAAIAGHPIHPMMVELPIAFLIAAWSLIVRRRRPAATVPGSATALSAIMAILLVVTGWYGGELVYRHMIGVTGHGAEHTPGAPGGHQDAEHEQSAGHHESGTEQHHH